MKNSLLSQFAIIFLHPQNCVEAEFITCSIYSTKKSLYSLVVGFCFFQSVQVKFQGHVRREGTICFPGQGEDISLSRNNVLIYLLEGHNERQSSKCQGIACS